MFKKNNHYPIRLFSGLFSEFFIITGFLFLFFLNLYACSAFAWNDMGHRVIGEIAYENLTPAAKNKTLLLIMYLSDAYPYSSTFQTANTWPDNIKQDDIHVFDSWHFYDKPYSNDNTVVYQKINPSNLLWAINQSLLILKSPHSNQYEKALFLRFLLHFVGDAHQPLHCIDLYNQQFLQGDAGGNLFLIPPIQFSDNRSHYTYNNLHAYWDAGAGIFSNSECRYSFSKASRARCLAKNFQQTYPESYFGLKSTDLNPETWVNESYQLAVNNIYQTLPHEPFSTSYIIQNQKIAEQQIVLAGYRLAHILNAVYIN